MIVAAVLLGISQKQDHTTQIPPSLHLLPLLELILRLLCLDFKLCRSRAPDIFISNLRPSAASSLSIPKSCLVTKCDLCSKGPSLMDYLRIYSE